MKRMNKFKYKKKKKIQKQKVNKINHIKIYFIQVLISIIIFLNSKIELNQSNKEICSNNNNNNNNNKILNKFSQFDNKNQNLNINLDFNLFKTKLNEFYQKNDFVNINEIESTITNGRPWQKNKNNHHEINLGTQVDPKYVLRCMMTLASIMDSQNYDTKIRFHIAVVLDFNIDHMFKIYSLRSRIREDVEFIFYNAKRVETDLSGLNTKGPGAVAKLLLPQLLPDDIEKIFIFDAGDLLVIKDISEVFKWDIKDFLYAGVPARSVGTLAKITNKIYDMYISDGTFLINVKKVKEENMYEKFIKFKNRYSCGTGDQEILNDLAFGKITYLPFKFGMISPFTNDLDSEKAKSRNIFSEYMQKIKLQEKYPFLPKDETEFLRMGYSPSIIHHMHGKWMFGKDLTVYRKLAQYYIRYAGIWDEICQEFPGYCK